MLICPACQTQNMAGSFFCSECGSSFLPSQARDTTTSIGVAPASSSAPLGAIQPTAPPELTQPLLRVVILNSGRKLSFSSAQPIVIGRQDRAREFYPDIDLTVDGGLEAGVSRRHARLLNQNGGWVIEDLNSSNGTFVNKQQVTAMSHLPVHHGDEVRLGNILLRLELT